nr:MAG TPA: hypothetical protein [Caudoviricetes sp.]
MTNYSADDVRDFLVNKQELFDNHLAHYGLPRRSGRYKWGSGKEPYQSTGGKRSFKQEALVGERYIKSKLSSSKRAQKKAAKAREKEENEKAKALAKEQKKNKYRNEKAYVKTLSDEELHKINNRDAMENQYLKNHPQQKPLSKKMVDMAFKDILIPAVSETMKDEGKKYVKKQLKELQDMLNKEAAKNTKKKK